MTRITGVLPLILMIVTGLWAVVFIGYGIERMVKGLPICGN